jgi:hypothetical protein
MTIKVVRGDPTPEEVAAVVAVLSVVGMGTEPLSRPVAPGAWTLRPRLLQALHTHRHAGWIGPTLPR